MKGFSTVSRRRTDDVQVLIESRNLEKALKLCDKLYGKGERSDLFLVKRALVLTLHKEKSNQQRGVTEAIKLGERDPPITGVDELLELEQCFAGLDIGQSQTHSLKIWDRASKAEPKNSKLQETRVRHCIGKDDFEGAQKAVTVLNKNFPLERKYDLWSIFLYYLVSKDERLVPKKREICASIAYRSIMKMAQNTPPDSDNSIVPRQAIHSFEELILLLSVYDNLAKHEEACEVLHSGNLGPQSSVGQQDSDEFINQKLSCLLKNEAWDALFDYSQLLMAAHSDDRQGGDEDFRIVQRFMQSAHNARNDSALLRFRDTVTSYREQRSSNFNLSICNLFFIRCEVESGLQSAESLLSACKEHFKNYGSSRHCYQDLAPFFASLEGNHLRDLLEHVSTEVSAESDAVKTPAWVRKTSVALSLEYRFRLDQATNSTLMGEFVGQCLDTYRSTVRLPEVDDPDKSLSAMLAAMGLFRLQSLSMSSNQKQINNVTRLFQASLILFHLISKHPDFYGPTLMALRVAALLGQGSLALRIYKDLSIKNLQTESFAHTVLTRISTLQPCGLSQSSVSNDSGGDPYQPLDLLQRANVQYEKMERIFSRDIVLGMQEGSYKNVEDAITTKRAYQHSICKYIYVLERSRVMRLMGMEGGFTSPVGQVVIDDIQDNRDFGYLYNFEPQNLPTFEERLRSGPLPGKLWVKIMVDVDQSLSLLHESAQGRGLKSLDWNLERLKQRIEHVEQNLKLTKEATHELTQVEKSICRLVLSITEAALLLREAALPNSSTTKPQSSLFEDLVQTLEQWLSQNLTLLTDISQASPEDSIQIMADRPLPCSWVYFHWAFSLLEALQGIALFLRFAKGYAKPKATSGIHIPKERQAKIREGVVELEKRIHNHAQYLKSELERPGFFDLLDVILERNEETAGKIGIELQETIELAEMEDCLGQMKESWSEGLAAIVKVKVGKTQ